MTSTVSELRVLKEAPRGPVPAGATLRLLVVAAADLHCAGIDMGSGALVRAWSPVAPDPAEARIRPYDVVEVSGDSEFDAVPDPAQPEGIAVSGPPVVVDRIKGRRCERLIRPLLHPQNQPLLGVTAAAIPFWQRSADHPSIALVEPEGRITMVREGPYLACRFDWQGHQRELPCLDRALAGHMDRTGRTRLTAGKGDRLVVALTAPIDGRCHKVVEVLLHRQ